MPTEHTEGEQERIEIKGELDAHAAAALQIEIRRLAKQHGIDIVELRCEKDNP
jgi:type IV pilus biogenesis protein CpaD/CtpE